MLDAVIRNLLAMHPRGASSEQLLWRIRRAGLRPEAAEVLGTLTRLADGGELAHRQGRWHLARDLRSAGPVTPGEGRDATPLLQAVTAQRGMAPPEDAPSAEEVVEQPAQVEWAALMTYYAATQRQDPRGSIVRFPDQHGATWQLFACRGAWWDVETLEVPAALLPDTLREALSRQRIRSAALGWPMSVFASDLGRLCAPALILAASWELTADRLILSPDKSVPALNPAWVREIRRVGRWSESELRDRLFPEDGPHDLASVGQRMIHALATLGGGALRPAELARSLDTHASGLLNAAALFLPDDAAFTRGVARDLEAIREWSPAQRQSTALAALVDGEERPSHPPPPLLPSQPLTDMQRAAAEAGLNGPLTVLQGPPGTGKSQVIVALIVSAILARRSVLFVARNHQALDEVEARLQGLAPGLPLIVRGRDADGARDTGFADALAELANCETIGSAASAAAEGDLAALEQAGKALSGWHALWAERTELELALCDLADRLAPIGNAPLPRRTALSRLTALWRRWSDRSGRFDRLGGGVAPAEIAARADRLRRALARLSEPGEPPQLPDITAALRRLGPLLTRPDPERQAGIAERHAELGFQHERVEARHLSLQDSATVLAFRPVWAVSTLAVPARIPLAPALFDYAIFDEASQCDIASALPVLARARRAVIVGDPMQLAFIPGLGRAQERALMDAAGLPQAGRAGLAQSRNSLYAFVRRSRGVRTLFLSEQFRSAPAIVGHLGSEFYSGRLVPRRDTDDFRPPAGYRSGIAWEDVQGTAAREEGGNVNRAEADRVAELVTRIGADPGFEGSVGVVSPFNTQVGLIQRRCEALPTTLRDRLRLRIGTVDKWQGGEADVILFSLVLAPGVAESARRFLATERRRLNVAISRARALCIVVGHLTHAQSCGIAPIERLARAASNPWSPPRPPFDSLWERRMDTALRGRGLEPLPQHPVGTRYLDFALFEGSVKLDLEVDGRRWHIGPDGTRKTADRLRDRELIARGWKVRRFWVHELAEDMEGCLDIIERDLGRR